MNLALRIAKVHEREPPSKERIEDAHKFFSLMPPEIRAIVEEELVRYAELKLRIPAMEMQKPETHLRIAYIDGAIESLEKILEGSFLNFTPQTEEPTDEHPGKN